MLVGQVIAAAVALFICVIALGILLGVAGLFFGHTVNEHGLFVLVLPMAAVSVFASFGRKAQAVAAIEIVVIFAFVGAAMIFSNLASASVLLSLLGVGYVALYALPVIRGWHYLFVTYPQQHETLRQQNLSLKLDADAELAEAALRHERALAALADAERNLQEAERGAN